MSSLIHDTISLAICSVLTISCLYVVGTYSPPSSSDLTSPVYPDRPIRPLPKRRLRTRLSPELADSLQYPVTPNNAKPLFYMPFSDPGSRGSVSLNGMAAEIDQALAEAQEVSRLANQNGYQFRGNDDDSEDEDGTGIMRRYQEQRHAAPTGHRIVSKAGRPDLNKLAKASLPTSAASSVDAIDGYDSFENTNNKKKRKIPTSGSLGIHQSSLSAEMANMGISPSRDTEMLPADSDGRVGQYYGTGSSAIPAVTSGTGLSGPGRGRFGRVAPRSFGGRSPLGISTNGSNALLGRAGTPRREYSLGETPDGKGNDSEQDGYTQKLIVLDTTSSHATDQGIISTAIANAAASPTPLLRGQENVSLLQQQSVKRSGSPKTQFTFTCESDSAKSMVWPVHKSLLTGLPYQPSPQQSMPEAQLPLNNQKGFSTQGTQTSPSMSEQPGQGKPQQPRPQQGPQQPKKPRRPPGKLYSIAARQRRLQQEYNNYHHPPKAEDVWICEFCEYESIFGSPPEALIRQYEIKDRRERRRLAEKRRLLEKAKMKGRKGRKGNKNAAKNANPVTNAATPHQHAAQKSQHDQQPLDQVAVQHQGTQSDEYFADDYDHNPEEMPALIPTTPSKIPQPIAQHYSQSKRAAASEGAVYGASAVAT